VQWGSTSSTTKFQNPSTLTAVDLSFNTTTDALGLAIGRLDWYNSATIRKTDSLDVFGVKWTLQVKFTEPSEPDPDGLEVFNFTIKNPINPPGDTVYGFELVDLSNLASSITLNGVTISNLRYAVVDGAGTGTSYFSNNWWYNDEKNLSSLYILADLKATPAPVPAPASYGLLLAGLGLLGFAARRGSVRG
jgi:hypothetical protein